MSAESGIAGSWGNNVDTFEPENVKKVVPVCIEALVLYPVLLETTIIIYHNCDLVTPFKPP